MVEMKKLYLVLDAATAGLPPDLAAQDQALRDAHAAGAARGRIVQD